MSGQDDYLDPDIHLWPDECAGCEELQATIAELEEKLKTALHWDDIESSANEKLQSTNKDLSQLAANYGQQIKRLEAKVNFMENNWINPAGED